MMKTFKEYLEEQSPPGGKYNRYGGPPIIMGEPIPMQYLQDPPVEPPEPPDPPWGDIATMTGEEIDNIDQDVWEEYWATIDQYNDDYNEWVDDYNEWLEDHPDYEGEPDPTPDELLQQILTRPWLP